MLRGNHECRQMTSFFNFKSEVIHKYDEDIYELFMESFDSLPLACIVNEKFIAIHGGISPELKSVLITILKSKQLKDLVNLDRFQEPPRQGLFW